MRVVHLLKEKKIKGSNEATKNPQTAAVLHVHTLCESDTMARNLLLTTCPNGDLEVEERCSLGDVGKACTRGTFFLFSLLVLLPHCFSSSFSQTHTEDRRQRELTRSLNTLPPPRSSRWDRGGVGGQFSRFLLAFPRLSSPLRKHKKKCRRKG